MLCRVAFGINFKVTDCYPENEEKTVDVTDTSSSQGSTSNPINIEYDYSKGKDKEHAIPSEASPSRLPQTYKKNQL